VNIHRVREVGDDWDAVAAELARAFVLAREAARAGESFVFVVHADDLLGRRGPGNAMVATGLLSAVRTAALEGWGKGWTANVIAWDGEIGGEEGVDALARAILGSGSVTGEVIRVGPGHLGKALP
jgi:hypothetical protein